MPFDAVSYAVKPETHDLTTPRGRLLYLRDVVVPGIPKQYLDMGSVDCGTTACLLGWAFRDPAIAEAARYLAAGIEVYDESEPLSENIYGNDLEGDFFGVTSVQARHLFSSYAYSDRHRPTHAELTAHINDVLEGRV